MPDFAKACINAHQGIAAFDADGTLWTNDVADDFTQWMIANGKIDGARWPTYMRIYRDDPPAGCRYLLSLYTGIRRDALAEQVNDYWENHAARTWVWQVIETLYFIREQRPIWIVSGTPTDFLLPLKKILGAHRIVGMDFQFDDDDRVTGEPEGIPCAGEGKAKKLLSLLGEEKVAFCVGNGSLDGPMMELSAQAWSVYPDAAFAEYSSARGWPILPRPADFVEEEKFLLED